MNRLPCLEFLEEMLRLPKKRDNILMRYLHTVMRCGEMVALSRLLSILYLSVCLPMRWLAAKTSQLAEYKWGPVSMGRALDTLREAMLKVEANPRVVLSEVFMMGIFNEFYEELPPFKEYWTFLFKKKRRFISKSTGAKVLPVSKLREECFQPHNKTNKEVGERVIELAQVAATAILKELHDQKKATWKYLTISGTNFSFTLCPDEVKERLLGCEATNDLSESALGGTTQQITKYGRINQTNAAAVSDMKRNSYLTRVTRKRKKSDTTTKRGLFHEYSEGFRQCLVAVACEDAPETTKMNTKALERFREVKREKEELIKQQSLEKASEAMIDAVYYYQKYNSPACWKGDPSVVDTNLKRLRYKSHQEEALKENVKMRVDGLGLKQFKITYSHKGKKRSVKELADHLKMIIAEEAKMKLPSGPKVELPQKRNDPDLGTKTSEATELEEKYEQQTKTVKEIAERKRKDHQKVKRLIKVAVLCLVVRVVLYFFCFDGRIFELLWIPIIF